MVLADTSVWIRFLRNQPPFAVELERLLDRDEVAGHDLIHGELLMGDSGGRGKLLQAHNLITRLTTIPHAEVVEFVRAFRLQGRGIGWIDAHLLASALVSRTPLWTADRRLSALAGELRIEYAFRAK
jgi:predicted nucleic acid-binding protein